MQQSRIAVLWLPEPARRHQKPHPLTLCDKHVLQRPRCLQPYVPQFPTPWDSLAKIAELPENPQNMEGRKGSEAASVLGNAWLLFGHPLLNMCVAPMQPTLRPSCLCHSSGLIIAIITIILIIIIIIIIRVHSSLCDCALIGYLNPKP